MVKIIRNVIADYLESNIFIPKTNMASGKEGCL